MRRSTPWLPALTALVCLAACNREDEQIKVYRVVKAPLENSAPAAMPPASTTSLPENHPPIGGGTNMPAAAPQPASNVPVPPNWEAQPLAQMRKASFLVKGDNGAVVDISLVTLGPSSDVLGNVNRWLGQLGQPPITEEQLSGVVTHLPGAEHIAVVDLEGKPEGGDANKDGRIIAAIATGENATHYFKLRGNPALAGAEKENFLNWVSANRSGAK